MDNIAPRLLYCKFFYNAVTSSLHVQESKKRLAELEKFQGSSSEAAQTAKEYVDMLDASANSNADALQAYINQAGGTPEEQAVAVGKNLGRLNWVYGVISFLAIHCIQA